jgi:5-methylcytosine-specific restriction enzyme A
MSYCNKDETQYILRNFAKPSPQMPYAAPRPCTKQGCGALVHDGSGRCQEHPKPAWAKPANSPARITGRRLQRMRELLFARDPMCVMCRAQGLRVLATERDHKVSLAEGGNDDQDNEQGLCSPHHREKTLAEALRGRIR